MFKKMFTNGAGRIVLFALVLLAPCVQNTLFGQALNMDGQSGIFLPTVGQCCTALLTSVRRSNHELSCRGCWAGRRGLHQRGS
jgi:hypothetical protein